ncbi:MAG TPA: DUF2231 domain-containing protein [Tepidisphaeraceae bacterium]|nr:DUF2231 domain-containing protein [Tepidisphaeraceae bacterium]
MSKEFINPNLHVILIHYPLGLLTLGTLIELFAFLWRRSAFRAAGRWMILLGALTLAPAATSGLYAMSDVNRSSETAHNATWAETRAGSPVQGEAWEMMKRHAWLNAAGSVVFLALIVMWIGSSDRWRARLHLLYLLVLLGGMGILVISAWYGGEMVYRHGVGVERVREADGKPTSGGGTDSPAITEQTEVKHGVEYFAPPLQVHVILAGAMVSLAMVALGLTLRAGAQARVSLEPTPELSDIDAALTSGQRAASPLTTDSATTTAAAAAQLNSLHDDAVVRVEIRRPPMRRFWVLAAGAALLTLLSGWWVLALDSDVWNANDLWKQVTDTQSSGGARRLAHVVAGVGVVLFLLVMAAAARMAAVRRAMLAGLTLVLLLAIAAQVWLGALLMYDTPAGPLWELNGVGTAAATRPTINGASSPAAPTTTPTSTPSLAPATPAESGSTPPELPAVPAIPAAPAIPDAPAMPGVPATLPAIPPPATSPATSATTTTSPSP